MFPLPLLLLAALAAAPRLIPVPALAKVRPGQPPEGPKEAKLRAARGECEGLQVYVAPPAEVLSADAYSLFEEEGVLSPEIGASSRDEILARGGSRTALESFVAFRGRPPQLDALLRHNGMVET